MNTDEVKLKPCAHCGEVPKLYDTDYVVEHRPGCFIGLSTDGKHWIAGNRAIVAWQKRTPDVSELLEALKAIQLNYNSVDCQRIANAALSKFQTMPDNTEEPLQIALLAKKIFSK